MSRFAMILAALAAASLLGLAYMALRGDAAPPKKADQAALQASPGVDGALQSEADPIRVRATPTPDPPGKRQARFASAADVVAAHLGPAPQEAQDSAAKLFEQQAQHFEEEAAKALASASLVEVMKAFDHEFSAVLRRLAAEKLRRGEGLLAVEGNDYARRIADKQWLLWGGGLVYHGKRVEVLVVFDQPSTRLTELDQSLRQARAVYLADALQHFNNLPYEERSAQVQLYRQAVEEQKNHENDWFGIDAKYLPFVKLQLSTCQVIPAEF